MKYNGSKTKTLAQLEHKTAYIQSTDQQMDT